MSDGGPGFVDVLHAALGGELARGHRPRAARRRRRRPRCWWSATRRTSRAPRPAGCTSPGARAPRSATTYGVGELVAAAVDAGAPPVVVGLGGSGTNDGGAGLLAALGATADRPLDAGAGGARRRRPRSTVGRPRARVGGVRLVAASDVDNPLTGLFGATKIFGPQKGIAEERLPVVDGWLEQLRRGARPPAPRSRRAPARPAGSASRCCCSAPPASRASTWSPRRSGSPTGPGRRPGDHRRGGLRLLQPRRQGAVRRRRRSPRRRCGRAWRWPARCWSASREMRALGIESAYSLVDLVGEERAFADPADGAGRARRARRAHLVALSGWSRLRGCAGRPEGRGITPRVRQLTQAEAPPALTPGSRST